MKPIKNVLPASEGSEFSDTQWTEVKALKCWLDENETKLEVWGQDSSYVPYFKLLWLHSKDKSFF